MHISVIDPVTPAIERTKLVLFRPFDLKKWIVLGFCAFLAALGEGGGSANFNFPNFQGPGGPNFNSAEKWIHNHLVLFIAIAACVFLVGLAISAVVVWLSSRGKFMFIDGIVNNRAAVVEPWHEYRQEGNSLFWFRMLFGFGTLLFAAALAGGCALIAWPSIQARQFGESAVLALVIGIPSFIVFAILAMIVNALLTNLVAPIMYVRRLGVMAAWREFGRDFLSGRLGTFVLYLLFQMVMGFAIGMLAGFATCMTCCLAAIPYVGAVILLPLSVFFTSYQLCFIEQFGPAWTFFKHVPPPKPPPLAIDASLADDGPPLPPAGDVDNPYNAPGAP